MPNVLGEIHYYSLFRHYILVNPICPDTFEHIQKPEWGGGFIGLIYFSMLHLIQIILPFSKTRSKRFAKNEMGWMSLELNILSRHVSSSLLSLKCEITPILRYCSIYILFFEIVTGQFKDIKDLDLTI